MWIGRDQWNIRGQLASPDCGVHIGNEYKSEAVGVYKTIGNSLDMASMRNSQYEILGAKHQKIILLYEFGVLAASNSQVVAAGMKSTPELRIPHYGMTSPK